MQFLLCFMRSLLGAAMLIVPVAALASPDKVAVYLAAVTAQLPPPAQDALPRIRGVPRQLLATRAYLRADASLLTRWSWTEQQTAEYESSPEYQRLLNAITQVNAHFEAKNAGYSLFANTQVRSLDLQIQRWNQNRGVRKAADMIHRQARTELGRDYPAQPDEISTQKFMNYLRGLPPELPIPLAAPGLSLHGQSRAIDFQIRKGDRTMAGPTVASVAGVWNKQGWARKLKQAIDAAPGVFIGPLRSPDEPWHYEYVQ